MKLTETDILSGNMEGVHVEGMCASMPHSARAVPNLTMYLM